MSRFAVAVVALVSLLFSACTTVENIRTIQQTVPYEDGSLTITASFLTDSELISRYGQSNPFIAPVRLITPINFLVFELSVSATPDYGFIRSRDIRLKFNDVLVSPVSIDRLLVIWENQIDIHGTSTVRSDYRNLVRAFVVPRDVTGNTKGLLIFQGNFPFEGHAILSIPHLSPEKSQISELKSAEDSKNAPIYPVFDGQSIHFNFLVTHQTREKSLFQ